jgi:hypothetical protein
MRKVELAWLLCSGEVGEDARLVPALPAFEEAFAAFARGTLFPTPRGLVGVEDLWPGMAVRVAGGRDAAAPVARLDHGGPRRGLGPGRPGRLGPAMTRLTRISADALGLARPLQDLVLGPHARVVRRGPRCGPSRGARRRWSRPRTWPMGSTWWP